MIKPVLITLKPTIAALVFLLVSSYLQGVADRLKGVDPCSSPNTSQQTQDAGAKLLDWTKLDLAGFAGLAAANQSSNANSQSIVNRQTIMAGTRMLVITRHAAQRMAERGVSREVIHLALDRGKLFAYKHVRGGGLIKIGYYLPASTVGAAKNLLTAEGKIDPKGVFVAVDQTHQKIVTVIRNVPVEYVTRLLRF